MNTKYVTSTGNTKIAYQTFGQGPGLLLVHSGFRDKSMWITNGWVDALKKDYFVITPDLRGHGESDKSNDPSFYSIENILDDFNAIIHECDLDEFYYIGHSYGATIGLQACKYNNKIKKAVCGGSCFGDYFFKKTVIEWRKQYEEINYKKKNNQLHELELTKEDKEWVENTDLDIIITHLKAWNKWEGVEPKDINTRLALYSGTNDTKAVLEQLYEQEEEIKEHNITFKIFDGLNHFGLVDQSDIVLPWVLDFLNN